MMFRDPRRCGFALLAILGACHPHAAGQATAVSPDPDAAAIGTAESQPGDEATVRSRRLPTAIEIELEARLALVEVRLRSATTEDSKRALRRRRLVLTFARVELARRMDVPGAIAPDLELWIASASLFLVDFARTVPHGTAQTMQQGANPSPAPSFVGGKRDDRHRTGDSAKGAPAAGDAYKGAERSNDLLSGVAPAEVERRAAVDELEEEPKDDGKTKKKEGRLEKASVAKEERPVGLMRAIHRRIGEMEECLGDTDDEVRVQVTLRMTASGAISTARVAGVGGQPASCLAHVLRRVRVPDHKGGTRLVRFPMFFQPT